MRTELIAVTVLVIGLSSYPNYAEGLKNNSTNPIIKIGDYSMMRGTNGHYIYVNPSEFWNGVWKQDTNGWRVQLRVYPETNTTFIHGHIYPVSTNMILRVEWGSVLKNSGDRYYVTPNGKFAQFRLSDAQGKIIPPNPNAGTNLLERLVHSDSVFADLRLTYEPHLPAWVSPLSGSLVANFPKTISSNVYPHFQDGLIVGKIRSMTNQPPNYIGFFKLDEIYTVINKGNYTLTVQPVLYKQRSRTNILYRVDLPCVTTKVHLIPSIK